MAHLHLHCERCLRAVRLQQHVPLEADLLLGVLRPRHGRKVTLRRREAVRETLLVLRALLREIESLRVELDLLLALDRLVRRRPPRLILVLVCVLELHQGELEKLVLHCGWALVFQQGVLVDFRMLNRMEQCLQGHRGGLFKSQTCVELRVLRCAPRKLELDVHALHQLRPNVLAHFGLFRLADLFRDTVPEELGDPSLVVWIQDDVCLPHLVAAN
mmetsp:Transcript_17394/g.50118  ORF Transcript_17394/g.50118 Transcript_17394/m.50118 type:complete len:216 (-) Transcript_17394:52-699(-)